MNNRFFKYLLLIFVAIAAKSKGEVKNQQQSVIYQRIFEASSYAERENSKNPHIFLLGYYGQSQIYRSQSQRSISYFKNIFAHAGKFNAYYKSLNYSFRQTRTGYVRLGKLILFPFHVFW